MSQYAWAQPLETASVSATNQATREVADAFLSSIRMQNWRPACNEPQTESSGYFGSLSTEPPRIGDPDGLAPVILAKEQSLKPPEPPERSGARLDQHQDPWSTMRVGSVNVPEPELKDRFTCAFLGMPILVSQLARDAAGARGAGIQVLNGGISTYTGQFAIRDAGRFMEAEGAWGRTKYGLSVAADLGMSTAAFAKFLGGGAKWATPVLALSYCARSALSWMPDWSRSADSL